MLLGVFFLLFLGVLSGLYFPEERLMIFTASLVVSFVLKLIRFKRFWVLWFFGVGGVIGAESVSVPDTSLYYLKRTRTNLTVYLKGFVEYGRCYGEVNDEVIRLNFYTKGRFPNAGNVISAYGTVVGGSQMGKYGKFLLRRGIVGRMNVYRFKTVSHAGKITDELTAGFRKFVITSLEKLSVNRDLAVGLILGKKEMDFKKSKKYALAGVNHILAVSGLHTGYVMSIIWTILSLLRMPKREKWFMVVLGVLFYAFAVGLKVSVVRAWLMLAFAVVPSEIFGFKVNTEETIALAGITILIFSPESALNVGFQLSFSATLSIVLLSPVFSILLNRWIKAKWVRDSFSVSLSAWLGTAPLVMYYFHRVNPASVLVNLLVVPFTGLVVLGVIAYLFSFLVPIVIPVFRFVAEKLLSALDNLVYACSKITEPFLLSSYNSFKLAVFISIYIILVSLFVFWFISVRKRLSQIY